MSVVVPRARPLLPGGLLCCVACPTTTQRWAWPRARNFAEIRSAHRAIMRQVHPDVVGPTAASTKRAADVNEAWAVLKNPGLRAAYDRTRSRSAAPTVTDDAPDTPAVPSWGPGGLRPITVEQLRRRPPGSRPTARSVGSSGRTSRRPVVESASGSSEGAPSCSPSSWRSSPPLPDRTSARDDGQTGGGVARRVAGVRGVLEWLDERHGRRLQ